MERKPIAIFSTIAVAALAALGGTIYMKQKPVPEVAAVAAPAAEATAPAAPAQPAAEAAAPAQTEVQATAQQQVALQQPAVEAPAAPAAAAPAVEGPSFDTVRVETTGDAVIAGHATPGAVVVAKLNGAEVGQATTNADGSFAIIPDKPLPAGTGALSLETMQDGKAVVSQDSVVVDVKANAPALVAKVNPVSPTAVTQAPAAEGEQPGTVQLSAVDYDQNGNIVFSGRAAPGATVRFYVDNALSGEAAADAAGQWNFKGGNTVAPGTHTLRADALDAAGQVTSRIELPFMREDAATVAAATQPAAPAVATAAQPAAVAVAAAPAATAAATETAAAPTEPAAAPAQPETQVATAPAAPAVETPAAAEVPQTIVIQPGNNLWKISRQIYGKGRLYTVIFKANRDQLRNPNRIYPGQILTAPKQTN